jgi:hypothetical protein
MKNLNSYVVNHDDANYFLVSSGKRIIIPVTVMHKMCSFDGLTDNRGFIKDGALLNLVEIKTSNGTVYYPNHKYYLKSNPRDIQIFLNGSASITTFSYGVEDESIEFKESFSCMSGIKETLVAFANSGHEGAILIGVNDAGVPKGLQGCQTKNEQKLLVEDIRNQIKLETASLEFSQTLEFQWEVKYGKTICKIVVPTWKGDIIFLHKEKLFVRMGATNQLLKGNDLVRFIENRCQKSA